MDINMKQNDRENLRFLLNCDPQQLREWYNTVSDDDLIYASELMERYAKFLESEVQSQRIELELRTMPVMIEAQAVIAAVRG
jgi:hypothetical protein